jgi:dTDP-4-amino-4,6-dideoxygalactose transaminase
MNIPFNLPYIPKSSLDGISEVLTSRHLKGDGVKSLRASEYISELTGGGKVLLTPSCTDALAMSSLLIGLEPGDEVIIPSFTFTSAALAIVNFGAIPVFVDIDPITKNIDVNNVRDAITTKTKAISVVNYAGIGCDFEALESICDEFELYLIEDNAHGLGGKYKEKPLGSFGHTSTQSFHETKNIQCGEGGAIIINDESLFNNALILREKGTDRTLFEKGEVQKYQWVGKGSSYLLSEILAGFLEGQLSEFSMIQAERKRVWDFYAQNLMDWAKKESIELMSVPVETKQTYHMFYLVTPTKEIRSELINQLEQKGIKAVFHYQSLHKSIGGRNYSKRVPDLPVSDHISDNLLRLPLYPELTEENLSYILSAIKGTIL